MRLMEIENNLYEEIRKNCSQIIELYKEIGNFIYHGSNRDNQIHKVNVQDRKPKDTPLIIQEIFDEILEKRGFQAQRHNSIFGSNLDLMAKGHGKNTFVLFPENNFNYTWFYYDDDPWSILEGRLSDSNIAEKYSSRYAKQLKNPETLDDEDKEEIEDIVQDIISELNPKNSNIQDFLNRSQGMGNEIMITGNVYLVPVELKDNIIH